MIVVIVATLAVEWSLFSTSVREFVLGSYPRHHDQVGYLVGAYRDYLGIANDGAWTAFVRHVANGASTGVLFNFEGAIGLHLLEADRLGALAVTFVHFAALQILVFYAAFRVTGSLAIGFIAVAMLLSSGFVFVVPGGQFDFRYDAAASCGFGLFVAALMCSRFYESRGWSIVTGLFAGYLVAIRFNTVIHVGVLYAAFLVWVLYLDRYDRGVGARPRLRGFLLSIVSLVAFAGPLLWFSYPKIIDYYVNQFASRGPIRRALSGRTTLEHWAFYPYDVLVQHMGLMIPFVFVTLGTLWVLFRCRPGGPSSLSPRPLRSMSIQSGQLRGRDWKIDYAPLLITIAVPLVVLTLHTGRSTTVAGVVLPSIVILVSLLLQDGISGATRNEDCMRSTRVAWLSLGLLAVGLSVHGAQHRSWRRAEKEQVEDGRAVYEMHYEIGRLALDLGLLRPAYITNSLESPFEPAVAATSLFERDRRLLQPYSPVRVNQIFAVDEEEFWRAVRSSDVVLLQTRGEKVEYPFVKYVDSVSAELLDVVGEHHLKIGEWSFSSAAATAYVAPRMRLVPDLNIRRLAPVGDEWLRFAVDVPRQLLVQRPRLLLRGRVASTRHGFRARAIVTGGGGLATATFPGTVEISGGDYQIGLDMGGHHWVGDRVRITVSIDAVPAREGGGTAPMPPGLPGRADFLPADA